MAVIETMHQPEASPPSILSPCPQKSRGRPRRAWFPALWAIVLLLVAAGPSVASDLGAFDAAVSDAYGHYREAAFYLRTGNVDAGAIELEFAIARWNDVQDRFRNDPPDAYADDPVWTADLDSIETDLRRGMTAADAGDGPASAKLLVPVRKTLAALRKRNGQWRFSDCVDEMNAQMDRLWRYRRAPPDLASREAVNAVKDQAAVTTHWYERCRAQAPTTFTEDAEFNRLMDGSIGSLKLIWTALDEKNEMRFINILRELRSYDRLIWLRFG